MMRSSLLLLYALKSSFPAHALIEPINLNGTVAEKSYIDPEISKDVAGGTINFFDPQTVHNVPPGFIDGIVQELESKLGVDPDTTQIDLRSGRVESLTLAKPVLPGNGEGNAFLWTVSSGEFSHHEDVPTSLEEWEQLAIQAVQNWMLHHALDLDINVDNELFALGSVRTAVHGDGEMIQLSIPRSFKGVSVLGSRAMATIKEGNLIEVGLEDWGTIPSDFSVQPRLTVDDAYDALAVYADRNLIRGETNCDAELKILTITPSSSEHKFGEGYSYVLVWRVCPLFEGQDVEAMEGLVDATTGKIYSFKDQVHYFEAKGGVYPLSNDGRNPDGIEQPNWPMPYMFVGNQVTDTGGNYFQIGNVNARFSGPYVSVDDNCGQDGLSSSSGVINWGTSGGTNCKYGMKRHCIFVTIACLILNSFYRSNSRHRRQRKHSFLQN